ncbi:MAG TPA: hypothetical protein VFB43_07145 [Terracidiphilus sp.]|nr:hypothetical protein [Terracidiphilus sp.]
MRSSTLIRSLVLAVVLCSAAAHVVAQTALASSTQAGPAAPKRQGFFAYVLGKINPQNTDYGATIESSRHSLEEHTIDDLYFWSNVVTLVLLSGSAAVVFLQWRAMDKRELIAASLIAQLWNGRVSDRIEIERRTDQFNQLVDTHNADVERSLAQRASLSERENDKPANLARSVRDLTDATVSRGTAPDPAGPQATGALVVDQQNVLLLQRRVEALQNSERNLKQRLNQTTALLDEERRRNSSLKGA